MSFAFRNHETKIEDAIEDAQKKKPVLVFAAASNNTALQNEPVGFPARCDDYVICINSSTASDIKSTFSPAGVGGQANLSVVGEDIWAAWSRQCPNHNSDELEVCLDGTSPATAIAAGVAALILDFARQYDNAPSDANLEDWEWARHRLGMTQNMRAVIWTCMTRKRVGAEYNFIRPWQLFRSQSRAEVAMEITRAVKQKFRSRD